MTLQSTKAKYKRLWIKYEALREQERQDLAKYLKNFIRVNGIKGIRGTGLKVVLGASAGKGREDYTANGRIEKYNLTNWKWVEIRTGTKPEDFDCVISLNMVEADPKSGNVHALYDRIGLYIGYRIGSLYYKTEIYTALELPLGLNGHKQLAQLVKEQYEAYDQRKGANEQ